MSALPWARVPVDPDRGGPSRAVRPPIAFSYGGQESGVLEQVLAVVDVLEISPGDLVAFDGDAVHLDPELLAPLRAVQGDATIVAHGIGLSIASHDHCSATYLRLLDELFAQLDIAWHSEHLGYTVVDGLELGTMLSPPRTMESYDLVAARADAIRRRYGRPFLLENVANLLPDPGGPLSAAAFLNGVTAEAGCDILLDVHNLECDAANIGTDIAAFLAELHTTRVGEIHVAGGVRRGDFHLDVHSRLVAPSTQRWAERALALAPGATVTYELLPQALPAVGPDAVVTQLRSLARDLTPAA
jgi:uncharacterized protein (UPF0276 family)